MKAKAIVIAGPKKAEIVDTKVPLVEAGEVLCRTFYTGISPGTELMRFLTTEPGIKMNKISLPFITGYLNVGEIVEVGPDVKRLKVGDIINVASRVKPGKLAIYNGAHVEYCVTNGNDVHNIKCAENPRETVFGVIPHVGMGVVARARPTVNSTVCVLGLGIIGLGCVRAFALHGCREIVAIDPIAHRREIASLLGATATYPGGDETIEKLIGDSKRGRFDIVVEASGNSEVLKHAIRLARQNVYITSYYYKPIEELELAWKFHSCNMQLIACKGGDVLPFAYHLANAGLFNITALISDVIPPEDAPWAYWEMLSNPTEHLAFLVDWRKGARRERLWN
ncbi:zinc-binding alcohol dehydrogenase [bacterium]|nr:zinc-binding alcohol dehydrogenase [bacterium]